MTDGSCRIEIIRCGFYLRGGEVFESTHVSWAFWCKLERAIPSFMVAICILAGTAFSAHAGIHKELRFAKGGSSVTVDAAVIRGEADRYLIGAMKGQYLSIKIQAEEDNAVFDVLHPGQTIPMSLVSREQCWQMRWHLRAQSFNSQWAENI